MVTQLKGMAFFGQRFLESASRASKFAGSDGRLATMPDIVDARLATSINDVPWRNYFTTSSAEYVGLSNSGVPLIIVAHGIGPMATAERADKAYHSRLKPCSGGRPGWEARIPRKTFLKLIDGAFGPVEIVELKSFLARYRYSFRVSHSFESGCNDPLVRARLGNRYEEYLKRHSKESKHWRLERGDKDDSNHYCVSNQTPSNCGYEYLKFDQAPVGHLLCTSALYNVSQSDEENGERNRYNSLMSDLDCHETAHAARTVGVRGQGVVSNIHLVDIDLDEQWEEVMQPANSRKIPSFFALMQVGSHWFTEHPKIGASMNTGQPEYLIIKKRKVTGPKRFRTTIGGYHGFVKYATKEIQAIAPKGANAYVTGEFGIISNNGNPEFHEAPIEFFHVEIDSSRRVPVEDEIWSNYELVMSLQSA